MVSGYESSSSLSSVHLLLRIARKKMSNNYFFIFRGFTFDESMPVLIIVYPCSGCQLQITILHLPFIVICCHRVKKICINYAFANGKTAPGRKRYEQVSSGHMLYAPLQTAENAHLYLFWRGNVEKNKNIPTIRRRGC